MKKLILLCSTAVVFPTAAFAQSTGSVDFEKETIVVTGTRVQEVGGVQTPDSSKPKVVLTQEMISRSNPGQTVLDTVNVVPGVSFQNNDAYGSSGGNLTIRGFSSDRISLTFDGIQLNDSGNYAIYSNQILDPELIEQVNVNLGTSDVDSPTASAVGGTVNFRSLTPTKTMGGQLSASVGDYHMRRLFGLFHTGEFTSFGTRAWVSASTAKNDNPFNNYGKVDKKQFNGKIYQPFGSGKDFVALAGHFNKNRNNFFGSVPLRVDAGRVVGPNATNRFPLDADERRYNIAVPCTIDVPQAGVADRPNTCGTEFDRRYNPSDTGNLRGSSRFTLGEGVVLTVDPSFQYVKANGGGTVTGREQTTRIGTVANGTGFVGGSYYFGRDLNNDGDLLDQVTLVAPSQTRTRRVGVISGLRWDINDSHTVRASYTYDRANHRQTGEVGYVETNGEPETVFPVDAPIADIGGYNVQKRDRQSYAVLHKVAGEYRGEYGALTVNAGLGLPFFKRDLNNYCFTTSSTGNVDCFAGNAALNAAYAAANPTRQGPQQRVLKYRKLLPAAGLTYDIDPRTAVYASYSKNISVPGTDNLYNAFFFPEAAAGAKPRPEVTDTFDGGVRYRSGKVQAQLAGWYTIFTDRLASAYDPETDRTQYRNLGKVNKYGVDVSVAYSPMKELTLYSFASWNHSKIKDNVAKSATTFIPTAGKQEAGAPLYNYGASINSDLGPVELGVTAKRTGPRYLYDTNLPLVIGGTEVYGAKTPAYWLVNLDARVKLASIAPALEKTYVQFNVYNLFDETYVGRFTPSTEQSFSAPNAQIGAPRTVSATLNIGF